MKIRKIEWLDKYPIAHRGYHNNENPENTLAAFKLAVENGYAIELDIQFTKDYQIVVFHDDNLKRLCGVDEKVANFTYDELKEFKVNNTQHSIPLFEDVLKLVDGKVPLVVEMKSTKYGNDILPGKAYELLREYNGDYAVQSFDPFLVKWYKDFQPHVYRGQLTSNFLKHRGKLKWILAFMMTHLYVLVVSKPDFIDVDINYISPRIKRLIKRGYQAIGFTAKNEESYKEAFKYLQNVIFENFDPNYFKNINE